MNRAWAEFLQNLSGVLIEAEDNHRQRRLRPFGRGPGVSGMVAQRIGMPPEWTDDGAAPANGRGPSE